MKKSKHKWQCTFCDIESKNEFDFENCKQNKHEIIDILIDDKSHTEYAKEIMCEYNFVTLKDSQETLYYENGVYRSGAEVIINSQSEQRIPDCTSYMRKEVFKTIQASTYVERTQFDADTGILNLKNGILNLETGEFHSHNPNFLSRNQLPVKYDPNIGPRKFVKFLLECIPSKYDREIIYEFFAYILLRDSIRLEKILMFIGEGANGKSTFLNVIQQFFGKENISNISIHDLIYNRFAKSQLEGKLANVHPDISNDELTKIGILKALISGDPIFVEKKGRDGFNIENYAKMIFSCNELPKINEDTDAVFRRFFIVHWPIQFSGSHDNKNLKYEITTEDELSGLLNLIINKSKKILHQGRFTAEQSKDELRTEWRERSEPIQLFIKERILKNSKSIVTKEEMYQAYTQWCSEQNILVKSDRQFTSKMKSLGFVDDRQRVRNGVLDPKGTTKTIWRSVTLVTLLHSLLPAKQNENQNVITLGDNDDRNNVTNVTGIEQFWCKTHQAGPFGKNDTSRSSGNILEFHKKLGCEIVPWKEKEENRLF